MKRVILFILFGLATTTSTILSQDEPKVGYLYEQVSTKTLHRILFIDDASTVLKQFNRIFADQLKGEVKPKNRLDSLHLLIIRDYHNLLKIHAADTEKLFWMSDYHMWVGDKILTTYVDRRQLESLFRLVK